MLDLKTLQFLNELKDNNTREWFEANRKRYDVAKADFKKLVDAVMEEAPAFDKELVGKENAAWVFRINRDIRFSKDKSPYKTNMGVFYSTDGKSSFLPGYYLHIQPGNKSFLAGGSWMPPAPQLKAIRQEIVYNTDDFMRIINEKSFKKYFKEIEGEKLKTAPKEYAKDHPLIEFLKHKSFVVTTPISDAEVTSKNLKSTITSVFKVIQPFNHFLTTAIS